MPLLLIAIAGAVFGEEAARGEIVSQIDYLVGQQGAEAIETAIANANQPKLGSAASIISIVVLFICWCIWGICSTTNGIKYCLERRA